MAGTKRTAGGGRVECLCGSRGVCVVICGQGVGGSPLSALNVSRDRGRADPRLRLPGVPLATPPVGRPDLATAGACYTRTRLVCLRND